MGILELYQTLDAHLTSDQSDSLIRDLLTILKGLRNGLVYGAKIRLPHAMVMTFLFRKENLWQKLRIILQLTRQHSWNLGRFVAIYKTIMVLLGRIAGFESDWHSFVAGSIGGYLIFSKDSAVNNQIVLYVMARVLVGFCKLLYERYVKNPPQAVKVQLYNRAFCMEASIVWGLVMFLFRHHRHVLQPSLQASMQYLYNDSDTWKNLWTLLIHNISRNGNSPYPAMMALEIMMGHDAF